MTARTLFTVVLLLAGGGFAACGGPTPGDRTPTTTPEVPGAVELTWWGQAMFVLSSADGTRVLLDPYGDIGYRLPSAGEIDADVATISHEHPDHNNVALAGGATVLRGLTADGWAEIDETAGDVHITSVSSFHDNSEGSERGRNAIFVIETDGMRIVHLGDLGQLALTPDQLDAIGTVDVLLIPVGGVFTIDADGANGIIEKLAPRIVIPMHYNTQTATTGGESGLEPVDAFLEGKDVRLGESTIGLDIDALPAPGSAVVWVLQPAGG